MITKVMIMMMTVGSICWISRHVVGLSSSSSFSSLLASYETFLYCVLSLRKALPPVLSVLSVTNELGP